MSGRVKWLGYVNGTMTEVDLGLAPITVQEDTSFDFVYEGRTYHRCYVEHENDDAFDVFKAIGCAVAISVAAFVAWAATTALFLLQ